MTDVAVIDDDDVVMENGPGLVGLSGGKRGGVTVDLECLSSEPVCVASKAPRGIGVAEDGPVLQKYVLKSVDVDSGSESSSSSSSSRSRSPRLGATERLGAAAGAAVVSATAPLDVDDCDRLVERELSLPTRLAMLLQHEGALVAIMAETGSVIAVRPDIGGERSVARICGSAAAVGRAAWQVEQLRDQRAEEDEPQGAAEHGGLGRMDQLEIPSAHAGAVMKNLQAVRNEARGVMIALQPPMQPGGPMLAIIGPGPREHLLLAKRALKRLGASAGAQSEVDSAVRAAQLDADLAAVEAEVRARTAAGAEPRHVNEPLSKESVSETACARSVTRPAPEPLIQEMAACTKENAGPVVEPLIQEVANKAATAAGQLEGASGERPTIGCKVTLGLPEPKGPPKACTPDWV